MGGRWVKKRTKPNQKISWRKRGIIKNFLFFSRYVHFHEWFHVYVALPKISIHVIQHSQNLQMNCFSSLIIVYLVMCRALRWICPIIALHSWCRWVGRKCTTVVLEPLWIYFIPQRRKIHPTHERAINCSLLLESWSCPRWGGEENSHRPDWGIGTVCICVCTCVSCWFTKLTRRQTSTVGWNPVEPAGLGSDNSGIQNRHLFFGL